MDITVKPIVELGFTLYPPMGGSDFHFDITLVGVGVDFKLLSNSLTNFRMSRNPQLPGPESSI